VLANAGNLLSLSFHRMWCSLLPLALHLQAAGLLWRYVQIQWPTNPTLHKWLQESVVINIC